MELILSANDVLLFEECEEERCLTEVDIFISSLRAIVA